MTHRQRLLDGMRTAIEERGYQASTVADVVAAAKTSRRTFYEHFPTKGDCLLALLRESNGALVDKVAATLDPTLEWETQVERAISAWLEHARGERALTLAWIRDVPTLGEAARPLQRDGLESFIALIDAVARSRVPDNPAGAHPPREVGVILIGGLGELMATAFEDGRDLRDVVRPATRAMVAALRPWT